MPTTNLDIIYSGPEGDYPEFTLELTWGPAEPDVGIMSAYVDDWTFAGDADKAQYDKILADGVDKDTLDTFIESEIEDADPPE